jgi:glycosyltransferase involved in cell wall biosynthesis
MRIALLSGIWPPDVGGPATHAPDFARFLVERGHEVAVVTMADGPPTERPCPVVTVSRRSPFPVRYPLVAVRGAALARRSDVLYATATYGAAAAAAAAARRPFVAKLVSDPAYERARRYRLFGGTLEDFPNAPGRGVAALRRARTAALRRARRIVVPSAYLARIAAGWGLDTGRLEVVPNPAPPAADLADAPVEPGLFVFAGRLTAQKNLGSALAAITRVPGARLALVGDGPEREALERAAHTAGLNGRVEFLGAQPRAAVLRTLAGAYAAVLPSAWENLPHAAVEALASGTPVVATAVGGVPEVVRDGVNGLLVPPGSVDALADALRRLVDEPELRDRLAAGARESVADLGRDRVYGRLESVLTEVVGP